jgi:hypothetical protein
VGPGKWKKGRDDKILSQLDHRRRACTQVLVLRKAELGFLHFLEIVTGWLVPSAGHKIPVQPGWYLPPQNVPLGENRFLQTGKGAEENSKENSRQCFTKVRRCLPANG